MTDLSQCQADIEYLGAFGFLQPANEVWGKIMFLYLSVGHSVHRRGVCPIACWDTQPPRQTPSRQTPARIPRDAVNKWAVHILPECISLGTRGDLRIIFLLKNECILSGGDTQTLLAGKLYALAGSGDAKTLRLYLTPWYKL